MKKNLSLFFLLICFTIMYYSCSNNSTNDNNPNNLNSYPGCISGQGGGYRNIKLELDYMYSTSNPDFNGYFKKEGAYSRFNYVFELAGIKFDTITEESPYEQFNFGNNIITRNQKLIEYAQANYGGANGARVYTISADNPVSDPLTNSYGTTITFLDGGIPISCIYTGRIRTNNPFYTVGLGLIVAFTHEAGHNLGIEGHDEGHGDENDLCCIMRVAGSGSIPNNCDSVSTSHNFTHFCGKHMCLLYNSNASQ